MDTIRLLFSNDGSDAASHFTLPELLYETALRSPLAPPPPNLRERTPSAQVKTLLPTPTPTQSAAENVSLTTSGGGTPIVSPEALPTVSTTAPITAILDQIPLQSASAVAPPAPEIALPTPTPQPAARSLATEPTPDGILRTARVPILMYHYLSVPPPDANIYRKDLSVSPELFAQHLDAMQAAGYTTVTLYELVANLTQGQPLPAKPVIITFDDGYRDTYENALPLLRERGMVASFFVVTDFMDEERPEYLTWDMAREMLAAGMKIESHGRNHVSLAGKDEDYLIWQALGSRETIEYELHVQPRFVSYPAGEYDRTTADLFGSAGYWAGVTTVQGATHSSADLFDLKRVRVRGTTAPEELLRLLALDW